MTIFVGASTGVEPYSSAALVFEEVIVQEQVVGEVHQIIAGSQFNAGVPDKPYRITNGILVYEPSSSRGGKFLLPITSDDEDEGIVRVITSILVRLGGQSSWSLVITDGTYTYPWLSGTTDDFIKHEFTEDTGIIALQANQYLELTTVGANQSMIARITYERQAT